MDPESVTVKPRLADDRRYCRRTLPLVSRTFAINIRVLGGPMAESVRVGYLLCRAADTLEDAWPGAAIEPRFQRFLAALEGNDAAARSLAAEAAAAGAGAELELVANLPRVLRVHFALSDGPRGALAAGVRTLAAGMARYAALAFLLAKDGKPVRDERSRG